MNLDYLTHKTNKDNNVTEKQNINEPPNKRFLTTF